MRGVRVGAHILHVDSVDSSGIKQLDRDSVSREVGRLRAGEHEASR
jgi:hypothetical protein